MKIYTFFKICMPYTARNECFYWWANWQLIPKCRPQSIIFGRNFFHWFFSSSVFSWCTYSSKINRLRVVPLSLSLSKRKPREKNACTKTWRRGAHERRDYRLSPRVWIIHCSHNAKYDWLMLGALTTHCQHLTTRCQHSRYMWRLAGMFWNRSKLKWYQSKSKRWNRASQVVIFLRICQQALERFKFIQCFVWQSFPPPTRLQAS